MNSDVLAADGQTSEYIFHSARDSASLVLNSGHVKLAHVFGIAILYPLEVSRLLRSLINDYLSTHCFVQRILKLRKTILLLLGRYFADHLNAT